MLARLSYLAGRGRGIFKTGGPESLSGQVSLVEPRGAKVLCMLCILFSAPRSPALQVQPAGTRPSRFPFCFRFGQPSKLLVFKPSRSQLVSLGTALVQGIGLVTSELAWWLQEFSQSGSFYGGFVGGIDADNLSGAQGGRGVCWPESVEARWGLSVSFSLSLSHFRPQKLDCSVQSERLQSRSSLGSS